MTVLDQIASSASNFLLVFLLARSSSSSEFGILVIAVSIITFGLSVSRNAFGGLVGLDMGQLDASSSRFLLMRCVGAVLLVGMLLAVPLGCMALAGLTTPSAQGTLYILAIATPALLVQDLGRVAAVAQRRPALALISDGVWLLLPGLLFFWSLSTSRHPPVFVAGASWLVGLALALAIPLMFRVLPRPIFRGLRNWLREDVRTLHLGADGAFSAGVPLVLAAGVAAVAGPATTAALRGASVLFGPLNVLFATVPLGAIPEIRRRPAGEGRQLLLKVTAGLVAFEIVWSGSVLALPAGVGRALLGETWPSTHGILPFTALEYLGLAVWIGRMAVLRVQSKTGMALRLRAWYSVISLGLGLAIAAGFGEPGAVASSLAISSLGLAGVSSWVTRKRG